MHIICRGTVYLGILRLVFLCMPKETQNLESLQFPLKGYETRPGRGTPLLSGRIQESNLVPFGFCQLGVVSTRIVFIIGRSQYDKETTLKVPPELLTHLGPQLRVLRQRYKWKLRVLGGLSLMNKPWHDPMQKTCPGIACFKLCQKKKLHSGLQVHLQTHILGSPLIFFYLSLENQFHNKWLT